MYAAITWRFSRHVPPPCAPNWIRPGYDAKVTWISMHLVSRPTSRHTYELPVSLLFDNNTFNILELKIKNNRILLYFGVIQLVKRPLQMNSRMLFLHHVLWIYDRNIFAFEFQFPYKAFPDLYRVKNWRTALSPCLDGGRPSSDTVM